MYMYVHGAFFSVAITGNIIDLSLAPMGWDIDSATKIGILSCNETGACSITVMSIPNRLVDSKGQCAGTCTCIIIIICT